MDIGLLYFARIAWFKQENADRRKMQSKHGTEGRMMARLIDANTLLDEFLRRYTERERNGNLVFAACEIKQDFADMISNVPTIDAVPVSELKKLRDYLYAEDLIFMHGLAELNKLIANSGAKMDEVSE